MAGCGLSVRLADVTPGHWRTGTHCNECHQCREPPPNRSLRSHCLSFSPSRSCQMTDFISKQVRCIEQIGHLERATNPENLILLFVPRKQKVFIDHQSLVLAWKKPTPQLIV